MNEQKVVAIIQESLDLFNEDTMAHNETEHPLFSNTFEEACLMTNNHGLVITVGDHEFQVTVVQSR